MLKKTVNKILQSVGGQPSFLTQDTTVNLTSSMTAAEIQALIDAQPKNLNGYTLTFQFADGTYTLNAALTWRGFVGGGLSIRGNTGESGKHTNQAVFLDFSGSDINRLILKDCVGTIVIVNLKIKVATTTSKTAISVNNCSYVQCQYCYLYGTTTGAGGGFKAYYGGTSFVYQCYVSLLNYGLNAFHTARLFSLDNSSTGTIPAYALVGNYAGLIIKASTQPTGSSANETTNNGGEIR